MGRYLMLLDWKNIVKMATSKAICRFSSIPMETSMAFSTELEQIVRNFTRNHEDRELRILRWGGEGDSAGGLTLSPDFRRHDRAAVTRAVWHCCRDRRQTSGAERRPGERPPRSGAIALQLRGQEHKMGKDSPFCKWRRESWTVTCQSVTLSHILTSCKKNLTYVLLGQSPKAIETKIHKWDLIKFKSFCTAKETIKKKKKKDNLQSGRIY